MIHFGTTVKTIGMLGLSVRKMKALNVKIERVTLTGKCVQYVTLFVYYVYEINSNIFFLSRCLICDGSS
jgi:hypothetical protein